MWNAALWGGIASSAVFIGALTGIFFTLHKRWVAVIMAFATGILLGAASFEMLGRSVNDGGMLPTSAGFLAGAVVFTFFDMLISKKGGHERKRSRENPEGHSGLAILIGTLIDSIPESVIIGVNLLERQSVSWLLVVAVFISNLPEGLSSSIGLKKDGYSKGKILLMWMMVFLLSTFSSLAGYLLMEDASNLLIAGIAAFAAGGVVAMVSSTMMPEAYEEGGPIVGLITATGLLCSLMLTFFET